MSAIEVLLTIAVIWIATISLFRLVVTPRLRRGPGGDAAHGLMWRVLRLYCRLWHRVTYSGSELLPVSDEDHQGLIVVSNHTGSVDPLLIQTGCRFLIRWLMATDTMIPELDWLWRQQQMIPVERQGRDSSALREAIRHVRSGGCIGIFPEGRIAVPPREIRPFLPGVGGLITRTKAPVLLVWVSGTPDTPIMVEALKTRSNAHVHFIDLIDYRDESDPKEITADLRRRIQEASGWPLNDVLAPPGGFPDR
ncbi:MAG: lysophospholipid acyltransferase family protein [Planctomycetota bacterium]|nr:lysophospholipid acyltransferase family protein [Planctomycetota bacterium]